MNEPTVPDRDELGPVIRKIAEAAEEWMAVVDEHPVRSPGMRAALEVLQRPLPETGCGALQALSELLESARDGAVHTSGPRSYHFVMGGTTPAALGADWLATLFDQVAFAWVSSPLAVELEVLSLRWLRDLFGLPAEGAGIMTTGATAANLVGLAAGRQWWGEQHGRDISETGAYGLPPMPVYSSGYVHAASVKVLSMLGVGRSAVTRQVRDAAGRWDLKALERELAKGEPALVIANAGEVNAGDFDPIAEVAELCGKHRAWLHVDGAFGLFAALDPRTAPLVAGIEKANSVTVDGHKWLNVPYDCGFAFVDDPSLLTRTFAYSADYLPAPDDPHPNFGVLGPESSRRARSLAVWSTLRAYGRQGHRAMIGRHLDLAQYLAARVDEAEDLTRLAEVPLCIVCFRYDPGGLSEPQLDALNTRLGDAILEDGRVYVGTTQFEGRVALRPAIVNWRTRERDLDLFVSVVRELGRRLTEEVAR